METFASMSFFVIAGLIVACFYYSEIKDALKSKNKAYIPYLNVWIKPSILYSLSGIIITVIYIFVI